MSSVDPDNIDLPEWVARLVKKHPDVKVGEAVKHNDQTVGYKIRRGARQLYLVYCGYIFSQSRIGVAASIVEAACREGNNIVACVDKRYYVFKVLDILHERPKVDVVGGIQVFLIPIHLGVNVGRIVKSAKQPELF